MLRGRALGRYGRLYIRGICIYGILVFWVADE